jgi:hypothetical protein
MYLNEIWFRRGLASAGPPSLRIARACIVRVMALCITVNGACSAGAETLGVHATAKPHFKLRLRSQASAAAASRRHVRRQRVTD